MSASAGKIKAGEAFIEIAPDLKPFAKGLKKAGEDFKKWGDGLKKAGKTMAIVSAAMLAPMVAGLREFMQTGDAIAKGARKIGASAVEYAGLSHAVKLAGGEMGSVESAVARLSRTVYDAGRGLSTAVDSFDDLGMSWEGLVGKSPVEQFKIVAAQLGSMTDESKRLALAQALFGRGGKELIPLLQAWGNGLDDVMAAGVRLLGLDEKQYKQAEELADEWQRMKTGLQGVALVIGASLAPAVIKLMEAAAPFLAWSADVIQKYPTLVIAFTAIGVSIGLASTALLAVVPAAAAAIKALAAYKIAATTTAATTGIAGGVGVGVGVGVKGVAAGGVGVAAAKAIAALGAAASAAAIPLTAIATAAAAAAGLIAGSWWVGGKIGKWWGTSSEDPAVDEKVGKIREELDRKRKEYIAAHPERPLTPEETAAGRRFDEPAAAETPAEIKEREAFAAAGEKWRREAELAQMEEGRARVKAMENERDDAIKANEGNADAIASINAVYSARIQAELEAQRQTELDDEESKAAMRRAYAAAGIAAGLEGFAREKYLLQQEQEEALRLHADDAKMVEAINRSYGKRRAAMVEAENERAGAEARKNAEAQRAEAEAQRAGAEAQGPKVTSTGMVGTYGTAGLGSLAGYGGITIQLPTEDISRQMLKQLENIARNTGEPGTSRFGG